MDFQRLRKVLPRVLAVIKVIRRVGLTFADHVIVSY